MTEFTYYTPAACKEGDSTPIEHRHGRMRLKTARRDARQKDFDHSSRERYKTAARALETPERKKRVDFLISHGKKLVQKVVMRDRPCACGCKGSDPWHARHLKRKIRNIQPIDPRVTDTHEFGDRIYSRATIALGEIKTPWGFEPVRLVVEFRSGMDVVWGEWKKDPDRCLI